jgi:hypothetical protein
MYACDFIKGVITVCMEVIPLNVKHTSSPSFSAINNIKVDTVRKFEEAETLCVFIMFGDTCILPQYQ